MTRDFDLSKVPTREAAWITDEQYGLIRRGATLQDVPEGYVKLYSPDYAGLTFGRPALHGSGGSGLIRFGLVEPHFAVVERDHPLLDPESPGSIWRHERHVVLIEDGGPLGGKDARVVTTTEGDADDADDQPATKRRRTRTVDDASGG